MACKHIVLSLFFVILTSSAGCKHNIAHIDGTVNFPSEYTIDAPFEQTWSAVVDAVMETTTIATMDSRIGYISSDIAVIDGQELSPIDQALFGQTYSFAYNIKIQPEGATRTRVTTKVRVFVEEFMGMLKRETRTESVENYLQARLHTTICGKIFPDTRGNCISGSTSHVLQKPPPGPAQEPAKTAVGRRPVHDPRVQTSQTVLTSLGYKLGPADGIKGKKTKQALMAFQRDTGLSVTGDLDDATFSLLQSGGVPQDVPQTDEVALSDDGDPNVSDEAAQGLLSFPGNFESPADPPGVDQQHQQLASVPAEGKPTLATTARSPIFETGENTALLQDADLYGANILDTIPEGTALEVLDHQGEYYRVRYQGKEGFVIESAVREH